MPRATQDARAKLKREAAPTSFRFSHVFPEHPPGSGKYGPLPKQRPLFHGLRSGQLTDAFLVYQGGKGSAKTLTGAAGVIYAHHLAPYAELQSLIGRESYPSLKTSTAKEFFWMVNRLPSRLIKKAKEVTDNSMGWVEWTAGGVTFLCSLSNPDTWESANLGVVWIDEAHRQRRQSCIDLLSRLRQNCGPRLAIVTSNPMGRKSWFYELGHPRSPKRKRRAMWIEASSRDNPTLSEGYLESLEELYPPGTPQHDRWVEGKSTAMEGSVLPHFDDDPESMLHVIPPFDLPAEARCGRGLDWGLRHPTAVVWAAYWEKSWWVYDCHSQNEWHPEAHATVIREKDGDRPMVWVPADPSIWEKTKIHRDGYKYSIADEFEEAGIQITRANNNRAFGLGLVKKLIAVDKDRLHPATLKPGAPRLFIMANEKTDPLIQSLLSLQWPDENRQPNMNAGPDDFVKKDDDEYDALRYLVAENPDDEAPEPVRRPRSKRHPGRYRGY